MSDKELDKVKEVFGDDVHWRFEGSNHPQLSNEAEVVTQLQQLTEWEAARHGYWKNKAQKSDEVIREILNFLVYKCGSYELDEAAEIAAKVGVVWEWPGDRNA